MLGCQICLTKLLRCKQDRVERCLDFVRDGGMKELVDVTEEQIFINFNLLCRLLHNYNFCISLLEPTMLCLNLKVAIFVAKLHAMTLISLLD